MIQASSHPGELPRATPKEVWPLTSGHSTHRQPTSQAAQPKIHPEARPLASSARPPRRPAIRLPRSPDHRLVRRRPCAVRLIGTRMALHAACAAGRGLPSSSSSPRAGGGRSLSAAERPRSVAFAAPLRTRAGTGCGVRGLSTRAVKALRLKSVLPFAYAVHLFSIRFAATTFHWGYALKIDSVFCSSSAMRWALGTWGWHLKNMG